MQYNYCQKSKLLNKINANNDIQLSSLSSTIFIYNDAITQSNILLEITSLNSFAVFGINSKNQYVLNSIINISVKYSIIYGSLLCIKCDVTVTSSTLIYEATGSRISTLMQESLKHISLNSSQIQFRINATVCSGMIISLNTNTSVFILSGISMIGYSYQERNSNANIISVLMYQFTIQIIQFQLCTNIANYVGDEGQLLFSMSEQPLTLCINICNYILLPVYGKCSENLLNGDMTDYGIFICIFPYIFDGLQCNCEYGYIQNGSVCLNILNKLTSQDNSLQLINTYIIGNITYLNSIIERTNASLNDKIEYNYVYLSYAISLNNISIIQLAQKFEDNVVTQAAKFQQTELQFNSSITELNNSIQNLYVKQTYFISQLNTVNANLNTYQSTVNTVNAIQNQSISTLQSQVASLINQVASLQNQIGASNSQVSSQQSQINSLSSQIYSLQANSVTLTRIQACHGSFFSVCNGANICFGTRGDSQYDGC
ncbi:Hypothetical_protein [Hexamita inflata]|uniref:Hypothetical_protein n=1 Tax=Hexamita inflata TaxID=28002 RepID=A0ABP1J9S7_9EUKA